MVHTITVFNILIGCKNEEDRGSAEKRSSFATEAIACAYVCETGKNPVGGIVQIFETNALVVVDDDLFENAAFFERPHQRGLKFAEKFTNEERIVGR